MSNNRKSKLAKEQEEIKRLRSVSTILNMGDIENAVLANTSKESEPVNDDIIDELLNNAASATANPQERRDLDSLERMTMGGAAGSTHAKRSASKAKKANAKSKSAKASKRARKQAARSAPIKDK